MSEPKFHPRTTPEGREIGRNIVRITEPMIQELVAEGEPDDRCKTCAFRAGTVPNGCPQTVMDVLKCLAEGVPFNCHEHGRREMPCHGWYAAAVAIRRASERRGDKLDLVCPWEFSDPDPDTDTTDELERTS